MIAIKAAYTGALRLFADNDATMKNSTAVLAFFLILAGAMVADSAVVVNRVPTHHGSNHGCIACSYIYSPVCGYSGTTHPNSCTARCKNDVSMTYRQCFFPI